ncbi:MAG: SurA N-terminal domain-containing protein [Magnetococcus sp. DMHC-1]
MLNVLRKSAKSIVIKILLVFLAISFGIWGIGDYAQRAAEEPVAKVAGYDISPREFQRAYDTFFDNLRQNSGGKLDKKTAELLGLKQQFLARMMHRLLVQDTARRLRLTVSPDHLRTVIATTPGFQSNGHFDEERYRALLHREHLTPTQYEANLTVDMAVSQLEGTLNQIPGIPKVLQNDLLHMETEERTVQTLTLDPHILEAEVKITPDAIQAYYTAHVNQFMTPLQVKVAYATLNAASVRDDIQVSDQEIEAHYQDHQADHQTSESRKIRHILAQTTADEQSSAKALEKIRQARTRIQGGESFADVARQLSDDATAAQGGDLGFLTRGVTQPEFEKAAFSLTEGAISEPVRTDFGYHLLQVERIQPATVRSLPEVSADIRRKLTDEKIQDAIYARSVVMDDQLAAAAELKNMAKDLRLAYHETGFIQRDDPKLQGVEKQPKFLESAFSLAKGGVSPPMELEDGSFLVVQVLDRQEPQTRKLEEVKTEVEKRVRREQADQDARKTMDTLLQALRKGDKPWDEANSFRVGVTGWKSEPFTYGGKGQKPPATAVRQAAFQLTMENPLYPTVVRDGDIYTVIRLSGIHHPTLAAGNDPQNQKMLDAFRTELGEEIWDRFLAGLRQQTEIKINHKVLDSL